MHAAGAAGAVVALGDCFSTTTVQPAYGIACTPDVCAPFEQDSGADASEAGATKDSASDVAADDVAADAPDGG
jgi:hypothetical protein